MAKMAGKVVTIGEHKDLINNDGINQLKISN
jgi:hypothetical protein